MRPSLRIALTLILSVCGCHKRPPAATTPRLIILGFDGVDPQRVEALVGAGKLPNLARLSARGYRGPLATTNPPQSPVAWASFATGSTAGQHGIFDFVRRDASSYLPAVATTRVRHASLEGSALMPAMAENLRRGEAFWDVIARARVPVRTLTVPYTYPPPPDGARALAGLGTPDVRGTNSSFTWVTTDVQRANAEAPAGGQVAWLESVRPRMWRAELAGPTLSINGQRQKPAVPLTVQAEGNNRLRIVMGEYNEVLAAGQTGSVTTLTFTPAPQLTIAAATRITVRRVSPPELYVEPLSILPQAPYLPLASPPQLARDLWASIGPYKTVGWLDDTNALGAGAMDEEQFLTEAAANMQWTAAALLAALRERTDAMVVAVFTSPDRIAHMFYRALDPMHPARDAAVARYAHAVDDSYDQMDKIVGNVAAMLGSRDVLLVMSDHGFTSFRRGLNLNRWLIDRGYMVLQRGVRAPREFFADVDWGRTRAYAFGTGGIYLNQTGRERDGIVPAAAARRLAEEIASGIKGLRDGPAVAVLDTYLGDGLYAGPARPDAPDVRVALAPGYRASWATTLGGMPPALFEDNTKKWSGDHASARPADVPGLLVSNRPLRVTDPHIEDLAATAYQMFNVGAPATCVGRPLID